VRAGHLVFRSADCKNSITFTPNAQAFNLLMRLSFEHNPSTEHTLYLLLFITNGGGL
jgi:hypothetical protein